MSQTNLSNSCEKLVSLSKLSTAWCFGEFHKTEEAFPWK